MNRAAICVCMCCCVCVWVGGKAEDDEFLICDVASRFNCC